MHKERVTARASTRRAFMGGLTAASYQRIAGANERVQIGCIGCGIIAGHHMSHLKDSPDADLAAMCDAYMPRAEK